ncbi:hypothetical protein [Microbacterium sp.]|uniref:hypothetical protein n=1 Tax=Microbacterium sp. TaxID=51671 RepID=UPI003A8CD6E9
MSDYGSGAFGLGIGIFIVGVIVYLGVLALALWIGYLIMRTAVKNGILLADAQRGRGSGFGPYPPQPPQGYPGQPGSPPTR